MLSSNGSAYVALTSSLHLVFYFYFAVFRSPQIKFSIKRQTKSKKELIITTNNGASTSLLAFVISGN